jgi:hypothetical protein
MTAYLRKRGETLHFRLRSEDAPSFLAQTGWTIDKLQTAQRLEGEHLSKTTLAGTLNTTSFAVLAKKRNDTVRPRPAL